MWLNLGRSPRTFCCLVPVVLLVRPSFMAWLCWLCHVCVTVGVVSDSALTARAGVSPHSTAAAVAAAMPKMETSKDAVMPVHSIGPTLYVKGLTYQHILSVDMFTKEQVRAVKSYYSCFPFICLCVVLTLSRTVCSVNDVLLTSWKPCMDLASTGARARSVLLPGWKQ